MLPKIRLFFLNLPTSVMHTRVYLGVIYEKNFRQENIIYLHYHKMCKPVLKTAPW